MGKELPDVDGDPRRIALATGRKMPAPGIDVSK
jgi:hypothetical protein